MSGIRPVTVVSWAEFERNPALMHNLFYLKPDTMQFAYNPDKLSALIGKDKGMRVFRVETADDLKAVERRLLEKPILMQCQLSLTKRQSYVVVRVNTTWRGAYAVLLNPLCPEIREPMKQKFAEGMELLSQGKKFSLEFDLSDALTSWYTDLLEDEGSGCTVYESTRCSSDTRLTITNHTPYNHFFDCNVIWCMCCLPCWFVSAPCYMCHRSATCDDVSLSFNVPVVYRTPLSRGRVMEVSDHASQVVGTNTNATVTPRTGRPSVAAPVAPIRYVERSAAPAPIAPPPAYAKQQPSRVTQPSAMTQPSVMTQPPAMTQPPVMAQPPY